MNGAIRRQKRRRPLDRDPLDRRNWGWKRPRTCYRRQIVALPQEAPGQPAQAPSTGCGGRRKRHFSRHKQLLGSALQGKSDASREHEPPARTHPRPHAPRRRQLEGFNRVTRSQNTLTRFTSSLSRLVFRQ